MMVLAFVSRYLAIGLVVACLYLLFALVKKLGQENTSLRKQVSQMEFLIILQMVSNDARSLIDGGFFIQQTETGLRIVDRLNLPCTGTFPTKEEAVKNFLEKAEKNRTYTEAQLGDQK